MKKVLVNLLLIITCFTLVGCGTKEEKNDVGLAERWEKAEDITMIVNEEFKKNYLAGVQIEEIIAMFDKDTVGNPIYPDYIGGMYIDDDDNPVVQIVSANTLELNKKEKTLYDEILALNVKFEYVSYSYNQLQQVNNLIVGEFRKGKLSAQYIYIDIIYNRIVVGLKEFNEENVQKIKKAVIDSPLIYFEQGKDVNFNSDLKV